MIKWIDGPNGSLKFFQWNYRSMYYQQNKFKKKKQVCPRKKQILKFVHIVKILESVWNTKVKVQKKILSFQSDVISQWFKRKRKKNNFEFTPDQAETLLHSLERTAASIGLHVNAHKTEYYVL